MKAVAMNTFVKRAPPHSSPGIDVLQSSVLGLITLATRILCRGSVYFADGPAHIHAIATKVYVIQPPGYWLFNRIASLFPNPTLAISTVNILFSVAGVVVFYHTATHFGPRWNAFLAALAYSSISYVWFAGEVHSTYASQILFPVLLFYALLKFDSDRAPWHMWLAVCIFGIGAGLRPFDGLFLIPMLAYFCFERVPRKQGMLYLSLSLLLCLAWLIPTGLAYRHAYGGMRGVLAYMLLIMKVRSITTGVNAGTMANVVRYFLPILVAFWAVLPAVTLGAFRNRKDWRAQMILLWILPGSLFFVFSYISDAPYLTFLSAAILLLGIGSTRLLTLTIAWNAAIFLLLTPMPSHNLLVNTWNVDIGKYTLYAIRHQWQPNLSQVQASAGFNN
jgi:4-amino-4-deoxy-L-arabinose transferase-like glycosyltransferase